jgi:predicted metal-dependent peptidase
MRVARAVRAFGKAAADHAKRNNGQGLGSLLEGLCEPEAEGKVDWRDALYGKVRAKISEIGGSDFAKFGRMSGRQAGLGYGNNSPRLPAWSKRKLDVAFAIDTSGSMGGILGAIQGELQSVCDMAGGVARLIQCDAEIGQDKVHRKGSKVSLTGGGGTSFVPVFDLLAKTKRPDVLIYATDLYGEFPAAAPNYPVIWAVVGPCREVPFGDIVEIPT